LCAGDIYQHTPFYFFMIAQSSKFVLNSNFKNNLYEKISKMVSNRSTDALVGLTVFPDKQNQSGNKTR
jgi:hypothetical protein